MKVIVLGAGVVGVTTAYYLAKEGHEVTVVDQHDQVGQEATGVNAGLIAPGHCFAWASPAAPKMLVKSLLGEKTSIRVQLTADPRFYWWGLQFLRECTAERAKINTLHKLALSEYSQRKLYQIADEENINYNQVTKGLVYLYRDEAELELGLMKMELLAGEGVKLERVDTDTLAHLDPAFASTAGKLAGAIHVTSDASGNSELFSRELRNRCERLGVEFAMNVSAKSFTQQDGRVTALITDKGEMIADQYVLALGVGSPFLSRTIGQDLPVYPAKGFSATVDIADKAKAPELGGVDEKTLVAWSPMGDQMRISSTAKFSGYNKSFTPSDFDTIRSTFDELWPGAVDWSTLRMTAGLRPMTPMGTPIIGKGPKHSNLFYNTGHGHMGWTMSCGSSAALVDVMSGRTPEIDMEPYEVRAFRR